jgi:hypothetical protein
MPKEIALLGAGVAVAVFAPGTTGWGPTLDGLPTALWSQQPQISLAITGLGLNPFGFSITGTPNIVVVVEACTDLANPAWLPLGTNNLSGGSWYFADPHWTDYPARFYRLRSP